jgi:hypothetical protein
LLEEHCKSYLGLKTNQKIKFFISCRFANNGDFDKAVKDLENALKLDSKHLNAKAYLREIFTDRALRYYSKAFISI